MKNWKYSIYNIDNQIYNLNNMAKKMTQETANSTQITAIENNEQNIKSSAPSQTAEEPAQELSIAEKLLSLYNLQQIWSQIDRIRVIRGELPEEVRDLEDEYEGMSTRIQKYQEEIRELEENIVLRTNKIKDSNALTDRYVEQQNNVRNNREYDSLSKEIEYQKLEIAIAEKHIAKYQAEIQTKREEIAEFEKKLEEIAEILQLKKNELNTIIAETEKEEKDLLLKATQLEKNVDQRLRTAFNRIRNNARNGLAIVQIERDSCGGCFSTIPPQRQLDIHLHKKIIVCEACGRIFIDKQLIESQYPKEEA
jgi:predicted  nucleic acid-binding Zn-ribbon protein